MGDQTQDGARWASQVMPEPVRWVPGLEDRFPLGEVGVLAAPRNSFKSILAVFLAAEVNQAGAYVWYNSLEDSLAPVVRPRCDVAGIYPHRTRISDIRFRFPRDLQIFREELQRHVDEGKPDSLVILDSLQRHIPKQGQAEHASEAMEGLKKIAEFFGIHILIVAHFIKVRNHSVEAAIGGSGVIQNLAKAIYIAGPQPTTPERAVADMLGETPLPSVVLACERLGVGPLPRSLLFEIDTVHYEKTDRPEPFAVPLGEVDDTALAVFLALREAVSGPSRDDWKKNRAATWIVKTLQDEGPMPTNRLQAMAVEADVFFSDNTFDRARKLAKVEAIPPSKLEEVLGRDAFAAMSEEERQVHWVRSGWSGAPMPSPRPPVEPEAG